MTSTNGSHTDSATDGLECGATVAADVVDFWFDVTCPWAWMTSRWMDEVAAVRPVEVRWHLMSLSVLNDGRDLSPDYRERMERAWGPARVLNAARLQHGDGVLKPMYDAMGSRIHPGAMSDFRQVSIEALAELGLDPGLVEFTDSDNPAAARFDDSLRASHAEAMDLVGDEVGTPVIAINSVAFFGPVISPIVRGEAAGRLFDGCKLVAAEPAFFELKRSRTRGPEFG